YSITPCSLHHFSIQVPATQHNDTLSLHDALPISKDVNNNTVSGFDASANTVTISADAPLAGSVSGSVLDQAGDFSGGVADLSARGLTYTGNAASGTFTATSANGKTGTSGSVTVAVGAPSKLVFTSNASSVSSAANK